MATTERWVWVPDETESWIPAKITHMSASEAVFETRQGRSFSKPAALVPSFPTLHLSSIAEDYPNLVQLEEFSEGAIIHQLRERYGNDKIYTNIGTILVSINPFKVLNIYTQTVLARYRTKQTGDVLEPHVFETAADAYRDLLTDRENQSVVISGESGAGKTEATKLILQYLSEVAGSEDRVEQQIMLSNPILEAFGNSKTLRNNNSSRFGKWMEIRFDSKSGKICAAKIENYLLEKSRVVKQSKHERNYHIFYQFCSGASLGLKSRFNLFTAEEYLYLNKSDCFVIPGVDDFEEFSRTHNAMMQLQFGDEVIDDIWRIICGILHLGNVEFRAEGDGSSVSNADQFEIAAKVLKIDIKTLQDSLCFRAVTIRNEVQMIKQKPEQASGAKDSASKALYGALFDWLVFKINEFLCRSTSTETIGVLDIFGFEVFEHNSFEQFCINYANEKLQQHFNHFIFKMEQQEYRSEGISFEAIDFIDNQECLDLIEKNPGILAMLDEEVVLPKAGDNSLVEKLHKQFAESKKNQHPYYDRIRHLPDIFIVKHYAGAVTYNIIGFVDKNKDNIYESLSAALISSKCSLIQKIFAAKDDSEESKELSSPSDRRGSAVKTPKSGASKKPKTLGAKFKNQLTSLMHALNSTAPHFIRCIKPNSEKAHGIFDAPMVLKQMRYAGLFEAIRVRASGFAYRKTHDQFFMRYRVVLTKDQRKLAVQIKDSFKKCSMVLEEMKSSLNRADIQVGKTKVFFRSSALSIMERLRDKAMLNFAVLMQSAARGIVARRIFRRMKAVLVKVRTALSGDNIDQMRETIQYAETLGVEIFILKDLRETYEYNKEEQRILQLLEEATTLKDLDLLEGSIKQAENVNLETRTKKDLALKVLNEAREMRNRLVRINEVKKVLKQAMLEESIPKLQAALKSAVELDFPAVQLTEAKDLLKRLEIEAKIISDLEKSLSSGKVEQIEEKLLAAKSINVDSKRREILNQAKEMIIQCYASALLAQVHAGNEDGTKHQIEIIKGKKLVKELQSQLSEAEDFLKAKEDERKRIAAEQEAARLRKLEEERIRKEQAQEEVKRKQKEQEETEKRRMEEESTRLRQLEEEKQVSDSTHPSPQPSHTAPAKVATAHPFASIAPAPPIAPPAPVSALSSVAPTVPSSRRETSLPGAPTVSSPLLVPAPLDPPTASGLPSTASPPPPPGPPPAPSVASSVSSAPGCAHHSGPPSSPVSPGAIAPLLSAASYSDALPSSIASQSGALGFGSIQENSEASNDSTPLDASGRFDWILPSSPIGMTKKSTDSAVLKELLKEAIQREDFEAVGRLLPSLEQTRTGSGSSSKTMRIGRAMVDSINKSKVILLNLKKAVDDLDKARMKELLQEARENDLETDDLLIEARRLCYEFNDEKFRSLEFDRAKKLNDRKKLKELIKTASKFKTSNTWFV